MMEWTLEQRLRLLEYLTTFNNWIATSVDAPVKQELGIRPQALTNIFQQIAAVKQKLHQNIGLGSTELPLVKRAIVHTLRKEAFQKEEREAKTFNLGLREALDDEMNLITEFIGQTWFGKTVAANSPKLSDFLSIQRASAVMASQKPMDLMGRAYDEKFQILFTEVDPKIRTGG